jgi:hypothetical protein
MSHRCLYFLQAAIISIIFVNGCTVYQKPRSFYDIPFRERSQSKVNGEVRVTVAVLSDEESRQLFGVNLAGQEMQAVWVRVQNADSSPYWLMSAGLDPDYFSPMESAYAFHSILSASLNYKIDPDVDEARYALGEDMIYSQQLAKGGYVKGVGTVTRSKPRYNLTGDPYFTDGYRLVTKEEG